MMSSHNHHHNSTASADSKAYKQQDPTPSHDTHAKGTRSIMQVSTYRAYNPLQPTANKYLAKKWDEYQWERHRKRLAQTEPVVTKDFLNNSRAKMDASRKGRLQEERKDQISVDNQRLLDRMVQILRRQDGTRVDSSLTHILQNQQKSLEHRRLMDKHNVQKQNEKLFQRLQQSSPNYRHQQWAEQRERELQRMGNIAAFPMRYVAPKEFEKVERQKWNKLRLGVDEQLEQLLRRRTEERMNAVSARAMVKFGKGKGKKAAIGISNDTPGEQE